MTLLFCLGLSISTRRATSPVIITVAMGRTMDQSILSKVFIGWQPRGVAGRFEVDGRANGIQHLANRRQGFLI